jgi:SAM-dependent methyltransferase
MFGIPIVAATLEEYQCVELFDVVLCSHTLEHVEDPRAFLDRLVALLKPCGILYLEVPNILWPSGGISLEKFLYHEHLSTFSIANLGRLCECAGLAVIGFSDERFLSVACRRLSGSSTVMLPQVGSTAILEFLEGYQRHYGVTDHLRTYARKGMYLLKLLAYKTRDLAGR